jgi:hypothetical protein
MTEAPSFFMPAATPETRESVFAEYARRVGRSVPSMRCRVYSITYSADGELWTATVGETLCGIRPRRARSNREIPKPDARLTDPAMVLAIFPGESGNQPNMVVTNHKRGAYNSAWENTFMVGSHSIRTEVFFKESNQNPSAPIR